jgi:hypothetical protein
MDTICYSSLCLPCTILSRTPEKVRDSISVEALHSDSQLTCRISCYIFLICLTATCGMWLLDSRILVGGKSDPIISMLSYQNLASAATASHWHRKAGAVAVRTNYSCRCRFGSLAIYLNFGHMSDWKFGFIVWIPKIGTSKVYLIVWYNFLLYFFSLWSGRFLLNLPLEFLEF